MPAAKRADSPHDLEVLTCAGLQTQAARRWLGADPTLRGNFRTDSTACTKYWRAGAALRVLLPAKPGRNASQSAAADLINRRGRDLRERFLKAHADTVYRKLTAGRAKFIRVDPLVLEASKLVPGLTPSERELAAEATRPLKDKEGLEIDQGLFLSHVLADPDNGTHLCQAMLLPRPESLELLPRLIKEGSVDLGTAKVWRDGKASFVELRNPRFLNAMDDTTNGPVEIAVDLAILDPATEIAVLRGAVVQNPKYAGRRLFCAGINLTRLYAGQISFLFYFHHAMGFEHKICRGLARPDIIPEDVAAGTIEKPWIATVDGFAIGGGCQQLLVMDYVIAANDAYMTLPARKEGIIPGVANLRLPRRIGDRAARQAIMYERRLECDSPEGRMICDEIVPPGGMDEALARVIDGLTNSGVVSAVSNRRAFRIGQEPLDEFRRYHALYAREQAYCHFSPALIANLERFWNAAQREI